MKVAPKPHTICEAMISQKSGNDARIRKPAPVRPCPMTTDHLRLNVSATTPVGISKTNAETSSAVPTSTICSGSSSATSTR